MDIHNLNSAFEEELYFQFLRDPQSVSLQWRNYFEKINGNTVLAFEPNGEVISPLNKSQNNSNEKNINSFQNKGLSSDNLKLHNWETLNPLSNVSSKIAINMEESLTVPTATSIRTIPVKALDENRKIINDYLSSQKRSKVSFSQLMIWAIILSLKKFPRLNDSYEVIDGKPHRIMKNSINFGVAIDLVRKDGTRLLMVPSIKNAQNMHFAEFIEAYDSLVKKGKNNKLSLEDLEGTTVTITNPGMIGTTASVPRLMKGMGLIVATGSIDYPPEFSAVKPDVINTLALSKVCTVTSTYDHRITQGAESAEFLAYLQKLLLGEFRFYDQIFASLNIPFPTIKWESDSNSIKQKYDKTSLVAQFVNAYRVRGHLLADVNPLGMETYSYPELDPAYYGFNIWDLDREFPADETWQTDKLTLRQIIELMRETYCGKYGIEYMHIRSTETKNWLKERLEVKKIRNKYSADEKIQIYQKLVEAEQFENFLHTKFIGQKRFSIEGSEATIVLMDNIFKAAADVRLDTAVVGMAHRGRLNILVNNIGKSYGQVFNEFGGIIDGSFNKIAGDVKYHLGFDSVYTNENGNSIKLKLAPNPSHLEIINPVVEGMARAIDDTIGDKNYSKALPILIHGDAAIAGQGISQETFNMSNLEGYKTGGTIHVIINNQIGFTTNSQASRSTMYASDIAKMLEIPIFHVNGNDPEAVADVAKFAVEYREKYNTDVVIDLLSYRKYGHNEGDEPGFTQPLLYKKIKNLLPVRQVYFNELKNQAILTDDSSQTIINTFNSKLASAFEQKQSLSISDLSFENPKSNQTFFDYTTSISNEQAHLIANAISDYPSDFNANPKVKGGLKRRKEMIESEQPIIDWAMGEALAFGALLLNGNPIRLSGEDVGRGTFSHRHAVLTDFENERNYIPLNNISSNQAKLQVFDSPLSELGVLGYDYGYSVIAKNTLTLWEAQFGDFANMAQPIIDQFLTCGEVKWNQTSSLVMLLPHGQEGQGPEHSSARLERFLQLCADENMIVANFTTPAQYFHALRRQLLLKYPTPLVIMTPKSTLRHQLAVSGVNNFTNDKFHHIIDDIDTKDKSKVNRIVLCTGKVYYDLLQTRRVENLDNVAIIRIEQLYPLHKDLLVSILNSYPNLKEIVWAQEEAKNQGAYTYILFETIDLLPKNLKLKYAGKDASATTATGSGKVHDIQQTALLNSALKV